MKNTLKSLITTAALLAGVPALAQTADDREAVKKVMTDFIKAYETDDSNAIRKIFRADGVMLGYGLRSKKIITTTGEEFAGRFDGKPSDDEAQRRRSFEILDVAETGAVAKVKLDYPEWDGIDYIALSKIEGEWIIISKAWSGKVKTAPKR
jgi:hypothetical protein